MFFIDDKASDKPPATNATTDAPAPAAKGDEEESAEEPPPTYDYDYETMYSKPTVVNVEDNKLQLLYP